MSDESRKTFKLKNHRDMAARLKVARSDANMTMDAVGDLVGLAQPQISRIESGAQTYFSESVRDRVMKWADILGVRGLEFEESYWDTKADRAREAKAEPAREKRGTALLTPYQQILALVEIASTGGLANDAAFAAIRGICEEQI
jgi:transcriptional regulator with XRE-family HTH domain